MNDAFIKKYLYNEILSSVEEEVHNRTNPNSHVQQTGGTKTPFNANGYVMPGKFEVVRNSMHLSFMDAIKSTLARQQLFLNNE